MATRGQTHAKRARELELKERRERKRAKKAEASAQRAAGNTLAADNRNGMPESGGHPEAVASEWIQ
jgi:hypothetical protein